MSAHLQLELLVPSDNLALIEAALFDLGAVAITLLGSDRQLLFEYDIQDAPIWDRVQVNALFEQGTELDRLQAGLMETIGPPGPDSWRLQSIPNRDWHRAWMDRFDALQFGERLWVCPSWKPIPAQCSHPVVLDPGTAFGTGTHETTAMCLQWLDAQNLHGKTVVDYGCGSGVLGIAAAVLGAKRVIAVDNDPEAVRHSSENAQKNHLEVDRFEAFLAAERPQVTADVVLANILAEPLCELTQELIKVLDFGGDLVLSGILEKQALGVMSAYNDNIRFEPVRSKGEWVLLHGSRTH